MSGWIGVDLDGTLAEYHGFGNGEIGKPIPIMMERVKNWRKSGKEVRIFTARVCYDKTGEVTRAVEVWCKKHVGEVLPVTCIKDYGMIELWDDRCVTVEPNTGRRLSKRPFHYKETQ